MLIRLHFIVSQIVLLITRTMIRIHAFLNAHRLILMIQLLLNVLPFVQHTLQLTLQLSVLVYEHALHRVQLINTEIIGIFHVYQIALFHQLHFQMVISIAVLLIAQMAFMVV